MSARIDAVRTGLAAGGGAGAAVGLMLAFRRQRHQEIATALSDHDAGERRITDLYTKAADQLGSDKAPVRLAGLYALERLAQDNPAHRQTIVNLICAYLRMPYTEPARAGADQAMLDGQRYHRLRYQAARRGLAPASAPSSPDANEERQVRLAAQRILGAHLQPKQAAQFWRDMQLDLNGAVLIGFRMRGCSVGNATFSGVSFSGDSSFFGATFSGTAAFSDATFGGKADFGDAIFANDASFRNSTFSGEAAFGAVWERPFDGVTFAGAADFGDVMFADAVTFDHVTFGHRAEFQNATFSGPAEFPNTIFAGPYADFSDSVFSDAVHFRNVLFSFANFTGATFSGSADFGGATFSSYGAFDRATFWGDAIFREITLKGISGEGGTFLFASFHGRVDFEGHRGYPNCGGAEAKAHVADIGLPHIWPENWTVEPTGPGTAGRLTHARLERSTS
ncbi:MAG TPA: pentapeptide repeat-containing protein [Spirillospora sp.]|nr:pentapeptide repeat-containing protein [Spirillospora sp.]